MDVRSYEDLRVWQVGMELVTEIYTITHNFPQQEIFVLTSQIRRSAISILSNLAEGRARESTRDFLGHVSIAFRSLADLRHSSFWLSVLATSMRTRFCR